MASQIKTKPREELELAEMRALFSELQHEKSNADNNLALDIIRLKRETASRVKEINLRMLDLEEKIAVQAKKVKEITADKETENNGSDIRKMLNKPASKKRTIQKAEIEEEAAESGAEESGDEITAAEARIQRLMNAEKEKKSKKVTFSKQEGSDDDED